MANRVVLKFGGGILKDAGSMQRVCSILREKRSKGTECIVVLSALHGVTDFLIDHALKKPLSEKSIASLTGWLKHTHTDYLLGLKHDAIKEKAMFALEEKISIIEKLLFGVHYLNEVSPRSKDLIQSFGERLAPIVLEAFLCDNLIEARFFEAKEAGIYCKGMFENAVADAKKSGKSLNRKIIPLLKQMVIILPGYYGVDENNDVKTFGRGGSDYSAGFIASVMNAKLEIWKDVSGFMSADPKAVIGAKRIPFLSYAEAEELGYLGAKILHPKTIDPLREKMIEIELKNIFEPNKSGTIIGPSAKKQGQTVKSIAAKKDVSVINISSGSKINTPGFDSTVLTKIGECNVLLEMIATTETSLSFAVESKNLLNALAALKTLKRTVQFGIDYRKDLSLIGVVGEGIKDNPAAPARVFSALARKKISTELISQGASRINISFVVKKDKLEQAISTVHEEFISGGGRK